MKDCITVVGMDAHKEMISISLLSPGSSKPLEWQAVNDSGSVKKAMKKIKVSSRGEIVCLYEAGPCGYALQRQIESEGVSCKIIAPSLIPRKPGDRVKTDGRDARKLAELYRAGLLTEVHVPSECEESVRDLCRCREDAKQDLTRVRHRLAKFLLRRGFVYRGGSNWTERHHYWLRSLSFAHAEEQLVFEDYYMAVEQLESRLSGLDSHIEAVSRQDQYLKKVGALKCFRGINTLTAMSIVSEIGDFKRFGGARSLMNYLGMTPGLAQSADHCHYGPITKTGNRHVRFAVIEAARHYSNIVHVSLGLRKRRQGQPAWVISKADQAMKRLNRRYWHLVQKGKNSNKAAVAVARELVGFIWAVMIEMEDKE